MDRLRDIKQKNELDGCTFKPEIDQRSEELISQRLARLKITGTLYDSLYEDAVRRRERQLESTRVLPPGVTFQPDIGLDPNRPSSENKEDFINRLAYSKSYSDRWVSLRRQKQEQERQLKAPERTSEVPSTDRTRAFGGAEQVRLAHWRLSLRTCPGEGVLIAGSGATTLHSAHGGELSAAL
ncbi:Ras-related protein Rab-35 [Durusdinium trenchii]|uniref:Ras-related protein Rab-35 n=1 Tax=Durusdinium trenchii TaxID=1381693 RepID=A0ABP0L641_9DINO